MNSIINTVAGISEEKWNKMLDAVNFENYTLDFQGDMTVTQNGVVVSENAPAHSMYRVTKDALEIVIFDGDEEYPMVMTGDEAVTQKDEISQLYLAILENYKNFTYDEEAKAYKIKNCNINIEATEIVNGASTEKVPVKIEIKEGFATVSADGKLLKLVCDYSQTMTIDGVVTTAEGNTTWTFTGYGTTTIKSAS